MEPHEIAQELAEKTYEQRFSTKEAFLSYLGKSFVTTPIFRLFGYVPTKKLIKAKWQNSLELEKTYYDRIPDYLTMKYMDKKRELLSFPNSDATMHWLRNNCPENMKLEDFESFIYYSDVLGYKWNTRYKNEKLVFLGIKIICIMLSVLVHGFVWSSIWYLIHTNHIVAGFAVTMAYIVALFSCAFLMKENK